MAMGDRYEGRDGGSESREERIWEEEAGMRRRSPLGPGFEATPAERNWGVAAGLAGFLGFVFPLGHLIAPLVLYLLKREESDFVADHAREALNFQLSITLYFFVAGVLTWLLIGYLLLPLVAVLDVVAMLLAARRASRGDVYRYPFSLRLVT